MPNDREIVFALILDANISGRRRAGTGPAPRENDKTYLHEIFMTKSIEKRK